MPSFHLETPRFRRARWRQKHRRRGSMGGADLKVYPVLEILTPNIVGSYWTDMSRTDMSSTE